LTTDGFYQDFWKLAWAQLYLFLSEQISSMIHSLLTFLLKTDFNSAFKNTVLLWLIIQFLFDLAQLCSDRLDLAQLNCVLLNYVQLNSAQVSHIRSFNSTQLNSTQLNSTQLNSTQLNSTQLNSTQLNSAQLNSTQLNSTQLNSTLKLFWVFELTMDVRSKYVSDDVRRLRWAKTNMAFCWEYCFDDNWIGISWFRNGSIVSSGCCTNISKLPLQILYIYGYYIEVKQPKNIIAQRNLRILVAKMHKRCDKKVGVQFRCCRCFAAYLARAGVGNYRDFLKLFSRVGQLLRNFLLWSLEKNV
jgi:hypothetical protein